MALGMAGLRGLTLGALVGVVALTGPGEPLAQGRDGAERARAARREARRPTKPNTTPEPASSWRARHGLYFRRNWGIDIVGVRRVASGLMLRFDYRVVEPSRATGLNDRKTRPYLIDEATGTALAVPAMENIGELRQTAPFEVDRTYFMIFGNPGGLVKRRGRVTLVVGDLRAEGLVVD